MCRELELLAKKHDKWIILVRSIGCSEDYAEDIVQDAYIRIWEYLQKGVNIDYGDDDVNEFYMYMTLRSIYFNSIKKKGLEYYEPEHTEALNYMLTSLKDEYSDVEMEDAYTRLINKIFSEVNTWDFYSRNIFIAYFTSGLSLDKLSADTEIGRSSLYNSIRKYREVIQGMFSEDVQDFRNGDFNKIK
jgi:DNA-directed RNA polymerase specialized sigma24 family protein